MGYGDMYLEFNIPAGQGLTWGIITHHNKKLMQAVGDKHPA